MRSTKTDNSFIEHKLNLRRYFLDKYNDAEFDVIDCCQGDGVIWRALRKEYKISSYWGLDIKPKRGRLRINSVKILKMEGLIQNVIDIDTYGSPFKHYAAMIKNIKFPTIVFLTIGQVAIGVDDELIKSLGLSSLNIPSAIKLKLVPFAITETILRAQDYGIKIIEACEMIISKNSNARYIGMRLVPEIADQTDG